MIIVKLMGGLGNQMFQYAFGKSLALKHNVELKLDISNLNNNDVIKFDSIRDFGLMSFNIKSGIATIEDCKRFKKSKILKLTDILSLYLPMKSKNFYLREPCFSFYKKAFATPGNAYVEGYWQSEKYFNSIRKELINDFTVVKSLSIHSNSFVDKMKRGESVSIHVRRGDYVSLPQNAAIYETCSQDYYLEAVKMIIRKFPNATFYIFSDEPEWFKNNVKIDFPVEFVRHNKVENSYEDLILMSLCKHNIIANSSFSWWGAWLNQNKNKTVIAPKRWFKDKSKNTKDLIPETWTQL
jgi:hypothetical protein